MQATLVFIFKFIKNKLHLIGGALAILAIFFVAQRLKNYWQLLDQNVLSYQLVLLVAVLSILYGLNNVWLALAWKQILLGLKTTVSNAWAIHVYGLSQIGKYIPGNIFHLAGRQALGMKAGIKATTLGKSSFWELAFIATAGLSFATLILPLLFKQVTIYMGLIIFISFIVCTSWLIKKILNVNGAKAFLLQFVFLTCSATIFTLLLLAISMQAQNSFIFTFTQLLYIVATYTVAWLAGLVTPGAPAGIGIREVVILFFLKSLMVEADLLLAILLGRIVSVLGDMFYFLYSLNYKK